MLNFRTDAERLIDANGRNAAGQAMSSALDCALQRDATGEDYWMAVALLVMEMQGRGRVQRRVAHH